MCRCGHDTFVQLDPITDGIVHVHKACNHIAHHEAIPVRRRNAPAQKGNQRRHDTANDMPPKKGMSLGRVCPELHGRSLGHRH